MFHHVCRKFTGALPFAYLIFGRPKRMVTFKRELCVDSDGAGWIGKVKYAVGAFFITECFLKLVADGGSAAFIKSCNWISPNTPRAWRLVRRPELYYPC